MNTMPTGRLASILLLALFPWQLFAVSVGDTVRTTSAETKVRSAPIITAATLVGTHALGVEGNVLEVQAGTDSTGAALEWLRLDFASGADGWVGANNVEVIGAAPTVGITATWKDNATNETGLRLEWRQADVVAWSTVSLPSNTQEHRITGLIPGTTYVARVFAFNARGDSAPSNTAETTTKPIEPPPEPLPAAPTEFRFIVDVVVGTDGTPVVTVTPSP